MLLGAVIEEGASVTQSIVCDGAVVKRGAVVPRGCLISFGAVIGENVVLPEFARISAKVRFCLFIIVHFFISNILFLLQFSSDSASASSSSTEYHKDVLGPDGLGFVWKAIESTQ